MRYKVFDVFARAPLEGNPTGIVYYEGPEDTSLMQSLAAEFPVPDTLFFTRKTSATSLFACRALGCARRRGGNSYFRYPCLKNFFHNCLITNDLKATKA
jgi:hypothetical protein